jgi:cation transport regulator
MSADRFFQDQRDPALRVGLAEVTAMPYASNSDLPASVQAHLPPHAQDIYREVFNHAFAAHAGDPYQEERAHRIAWAAVKRSYVKVGGS